MDDNNTNNNRPRTNNNNNNNNNNDLVMHISPTPLNRQQQLGASVCQWVEAGLACGYNRPTQTPPPSTPTPSSSQIHRLVRDCRGRVWSLTLAHEVTERWGLVGEGPQPPPTPHQPTISDELTRARRELDILTTDLAAKKREVDTLEQMLNHPLFDTIPTRVIEKDIFF